LVKAATSTAANRRSFVGRSREIDQIERAFGEGARLVTVTGPAGTGKTRLVERFVELERQVADRDELWFCDLSQAQGGADLCSVVGEALGVEHTAAAIARSLDSRGRCLVVLDNLEHLVDHAVPLVRLWQDEAQEAEFLITSRERLRLEDERCIALGPLPVPPPDARALEQVLAFDAARLFLDRARSADPGFVLDRSDAARLAAIVRSLDGIPLAIELAAARAGMLGLPELVALLERRFELLVAEGTSGVRRHATLRRAIDWSWDLLEPAARRALARSGVFRGGFSFEAFEHVAGAHEGASLDLIQSLHDKSFLNASTPEGLAGERRFSLYESVRVYACERLDASGELEAAETLHAEYYLGAAERWAGALDGPRGSEMRRRLELACENLLAVHERGLGRGDARGVEEALRAAIALESVFATRGPFDRYLTLLQSALASSRAAALPEAVSARAYLARGRTHVLQGRFAEALHDFVQALELGKRSGSPSIVAAAALKAGQAAAIEGRAEEADTHFESAKALISELGDPVLERQYASDLSMVRAAQGRPREALALTERALELAQRLGNQRVQGALLGNAGARLNELGRIPEAREHYEHAIALLIEVGDRRAAAVFEAHIASVELELGEVASARKRLARALAVQREVGDWAWEGLIQGFLGHSALLSGRPREAASSYREAGSILPGSYRRWAGLFLAAQATAEAKLGDARAAEAHLASALEITLAVGAPLDRMAREIYAALVRFFTAPEDQRGLAADAARELAARARADSATALPDEVRFALRVLDRELGPAAPPAELSRPGPEELCIGSDGSWFESIPGQPVDLSRRSALRALLAELARRRQSEPGAGVSLDRLFEAAWPGARIGSESRAARVYVAIGTLRKLGLASVLLRQDDGYLLDPLVPVRIATD
jgi:predicted ATPase